MSNIRFRLAKPCDAKQLADCHWHVRDRYTKGIFLSLGKSFLREYYKIILNDPYEVVVCAETETGKVIGFSSATLDAAKQAENLKLLRPRASESLRIQKPILTKQLLGAQKEGVIPVLTDQKSFC